MRAVSLRMAGMIFLAWLALPLAMTPWTKAGNEKFIRDWEKRAPAAWTGIRHGREWFQAGTYQRISAICEDRVPLRSFFILAHNTASERLFGQDRFEKVDVGRDGWLFVRDAYDRPTENLQHARRALRLLDEFFLKPGRYRADVRVVIVPEKHLVYPENMSRAGSRDAGRFRWRHDLLKDFMDHHPSGKLLGLWPHYLRAKSRTRAWLYYPHDTHHTAHGAMVMLKSIVEFLQPGLWNDRDVVQNGRSKKIGDLTLMAALLRPHDWRMHLDLRRPGIRRVSRTWLGRSDVIPGDDWEDPLRIISEGPAGGLLAGKTLLLHDSAFQYSRDPFSRFFTDLTCRHYLDVIASDGFRYALDEYDRIIVEVGERMAVTILQNLFQSVTAESLARVHAGNLREIMPGRAVEVKRSGNDILLNYTHADPCIFLPGRKVPSQGDYALRVDISVSKPAVSQLFWLNAPRQTYSEARSAFRSLQTGRNYLYFPLEAEQAGLPLRFDPDTASGSCRIPAFDICRVAGCSEPRIFSGTASPDNSRYALPVLEQGRGGGRASLVQENLAASPAAGIARSEAGLALSASGNDPWLILPPVKADLGPHPVMEVVLDAPEKTLSQIFYLDGPGQGFREALSQSLTARAGSSRLRFVLPPAALDYPLRFDPGCSPGEYLIKSLLFRPAAGKLHRSGTEARTMVRQIYPYTMLLEVNEQTVGGITGNVQAKVRRQGNGMLVAATGDDPCIYLPRIGDFSDGDYILSVRMDSQRETFSQLFYLDRTVSAYSEARQAGRAVHAGPNELFFLLRAEHLRKPLRFDPGCHPGTYLIRSMHLYGAVPEPGEPPQVIQAN